VAIANEFRKTLENILDFSLEWRDLIRFAGNFADAPGVCIPAVYPDQSSRRVLTTDRLQGLSFSNREARLRLDLTCPSLSDAVQKSFCRWSFETDFIIRPASGQPDGA
jgi:predicted unusual protein kinase regulating ubiquinone biosynthesis (AarF/ABC1/UbiB family)